MNNKKRILCKDCEFYRKNLDVIDAASCYHSDSLKRLDHVNGFDEYYDCRFMRMRDSICGTSAKLFKQLGTE